jgi:hypothetical protein
MESTASQEIPLVRALQASSPVATLLIATEITQIVAQALSAVGIIFAAVYEPPAYFGISTIATRTYCSLF